MTPKEQYEAKKAARKARREQEGRNTHRVGEDDEIMELLLERFVSAAERIADALERPDQ